MEHRLVAAGYGGWGNWEECSCGWVGGPFEGHTMLPPEERIPTFPEGYIKSEADYRKEIRELHNI